MQRLLHVISHTDLDGVAAAALAWHAARAGGRIVKVSLTGYGEVDNLLLEALTNGEEPLVLDLFCQREQTVDVVDRSWREDYPPFLFDHHRSTFERYGNRKWAVVDMSRCGALVYWNWLAQNRKDEKSISVLQKLEPIVKVANDRDLWLGEIPESRLWQGLITLCGWWSVFARLAENPSAQLTDAEMAAAKDFVARQEKRFEEARESVLRSGSDLSFVREGVLEFGDVSDFCGLILDRDPDPPLVAAVCAKRFNGDWAVSMRSRDGLAGKIMALLKDGKKIKGGGHGDASALYFPKSYGEEQIRDSILAAIRAEKERNQPTGVTLGDLFKGLA